MKTHIARYLDSGFYYISDAAAGALCSVIGQPLPKHGYQKFVMLEANGHKLNARLQRTPVQHSMLAPNARGWRWAVFALRPDGERPPVTLGKEFQFTPINSTVLIPA